jgi:hypothetical protein
VPHGLKNGKTDFSPSKLMATTEHEISHADIYHKLGSLEAKLDAVMTNVIDYKENLNEAFVRIRKVEEKMIWMVGAVAGLTLIMPLLVHIIGSSFHVQMKPKNEISLVQPK